MSRDANWAQVLDVMYEEGDYQSLKSLNENYEFDLKMTQEQVSGEFSEKIDDRMQPGMLLVNTLQNLEKIGLITWYDDEEDAFDHKNRFILTERGFQIAHDRKLRKREQKTLSQTNKAYWLIGILTVVLAFGEVVNALNVLGVF